MTRTGRRLDFASAGMALLFAAVAADLLGIGTDRPALWISGAYLAAAGLVAGTLALVARLLGIRGLSGPVTRRGRFWRAVPGVLALTLFALAWWVRGDASIPPDPAVLLAEVLGVALLVAGEEMHRRARNRIEDGADP